MSYRQERVISSCLWDYGPAAITVERLKPIAMDPSQTPEAPENSVVTKLPNFTLHTWKEVNYLALFPEFCKRCFDITAFAIMLIFSSIQSTETNSYKRNTKLPVKGNGL